MCYTKASEQGDKEDDDDGDEQCDFDAMMDMLDEDDSDIEDEDVQCPATMTSSDGASSGGRSGVGSETNGDGGVGAKKISPTTTRVNNIKSPASSSSSQRSGVSIVDSKSKSLAKPQNSLFYF